MATTNEYSNVYIADLAGTNKIYMDVNPSPMPFIPVPKRVQKTTQCLCGLNSGVITAGKNIHWDAGAHLTGTEMAWSCSMATQTTCNNLKTKYDKIEDVLFSLDDGTVISTFDKTVDITVAGAGGLDTGSEASSTYYYLLVIYNGATYNFC